MLHTTPQTDDNTFDDTLGARIDSLSRLISPDSPEGQFLSFLKNRWDNDRLTVRDWSAVNLIADRAQA
jgi:hypothetical protein